VGGEGQQRGDTLWWEHHVTTQPEHTLYHPNGAPVLLEEDVVTVTKLLAVRLVPKGLKIVFCLFVGYEENQTKSSPWMRPEVDMHACKKATCQLR
jgi:hypothetical protein